MLEPSHYHRRATLSASSGRMAAKNENYRHIYKTRLQPIPYVGETEPYQKVSSWRDAVSVPITCWRVIAIEDTSCFMCRKKHSAA
jgi:hypothetical protein